MRRNRKRLTIEIDPPDIALIKKAKIKAISQGFKDMRQLTLALFRAYLDQE